MDTDNNGTIDQNELAGILQLLGLQDFVVPPPLPGGLIPSRLDGRLLDPPRVGVGVPALRRPGLSGRTPGPLRILRPFAPALLALFAPTVAAAMDATPMDAIQWAIQ
jgi:hypothetical protein